MTKRFLIPVITGAGLLLISMSVFQFSYGSKAHSDRETEIESKAHSDHEGHDHHDHDGSKPLEELIHEDCEHETPIYQCDECRYEIGMVKVPDTLMKGSDQKILQTLVVKKQTIGTGLNVTGEISLNENRTVHVSPRVAGIIDTTHIDLGMEVEKDQLLFKVFSTELGKTLSDYQRHLTLSDLSKKNYEREKVLFERKISSEQEMVEAEMVYEQHRAEMEATAQALHVMGIMKPDLSHLNKKGQGNGMGSLPVTAPIAGTVIEKHAVAGEFVEPGKDVMLISDLSTVWVWADIYEQDLSQLVQAKKDGPVVVIISVKAFPEHSFKGIVDYVSPVMTSRTRTIKVRATIENEDFALRPGMFCEIKMAIGDSESILAVPPVALLTDEKQDFVFFHFKDNLFVRRLVTRGRDFIDKIEILDGLSEGETIVSNGAFLLKSDILREKMGAGCAD